MTQLVRFLISKFKRCMAHGAIYKHVIACTTTDMHDLDQSADWICEYTLHMCAVDMWWSDGVVAAKVRDEPTSYDHLIHL